MPLASQPVPPPIVFIHSHRKYKSRKTLRLHHSFIPYSHPTRRPTPVFKMTYIPALLLSGANILMTLSLCEGLNAPGSGPRKGPTPKTLSNFTDCYLSFCRIPLRIKIVYFYFLSLSGGNKETIHSSIYHSFSFITLPHSHSQPSTGAAA